MGLSSDREPDAPDGGVGTLAERARSTATTLAVLALVALVADALLTGLTFTAMALWTAVYVAVLVPAVGILAGLHAVRALPRSGGTLERERGAG